LLEPLLLQLEAPLASSQHQLLLGSLDTIACRLSGEEPGQQRFSAEPALWIAEAEALRAPKPLLLAIAQQSEQLHDLLHSRGLLQLAIQQLQGANR
jgi:hypothetical protein